MQWYLMVLKKYAEFNGRSQRKEYWYFTLISSVISIILAFVSMSSDLTFMNGQYGILDTVYQLAVLIPSIAVSVRRLHDTSHSGWWMLLVFVPFVGWIWLIVLMATDSDAGANAHGVNPKAA